MVAGAVVHRVAARRLSSACLAALLLVTIPAQATAQTSHSVEIFGGYAFTHDALNNVSLPASNFTLSSTWGIKGVLLSDSDSRL